MSLLPSSGTVAKNQVLVPKATLLAAVRVKGLEY